jgi:hypothetical protein
MDSGGSNPSTLPMEIATGEVVYLRPGQESSEYRTLLWKGELYECLPQDLLDAFIPALPRPTWNDDKVSQVPDVARTAERTVIAALAGQLANGTKYAPGDRIPVGWDSSRERVFITVTPEMLTQAAAAIRVD